MINIKKIIQNFRKYSEALLTSYSDIFFLKNRYAGVVILLTTLYDPNLALTGIISVAAAFLFACVIKMNGNFLKSGFYTYNPLLVGLSIGYIFKLSLLTIFLTICAGIFTFIVTIALTNVLFQYFQLPILSIPFVIVSLLIYLSSSHYDTLYVSGTTVHNDLLSKIIAFPFWVEGFFKSLGAILFLPYVLPGIVLTIVLLFSSRILFFLAVLGYYIGSITTGILIGSFEHSFLNVFHFNYILIMIAIGCIFTIPSLRSYFLAIIAVLVSTFLIKAIEICCSSYGIPGFTLPFNLVSLSFIYVLRIVYYPEITTIFKQTPEETLDNYLSNIKRYSKVINCISLPFAGKWTVWQGFHGKWTHTGNQQYSYDFIITDERKNSYQNDGKGLNDYYAFNKVILSPVSGRVISVMNYLQDNPIGHIDLNHPWGNFIIIKDERGFFVEISHFLKNSITVSEGDWVEKGFIIGRCGNSGNSPQPHIHIQVQATQDKAAYTIPFSFINYLTDNYLYTNNIPSEGQIVEAVIFNKRLNLQTSLAIDDEYTFEVYKDQKRTDRFTIQVKINSEGMFYFSSQNSKLFFGKNNETFFIYSLDGRNKHLKNLFMALPRLPLGYQHNLKWKDHLPLSVVSKGLQKEILHFLTSFNHKNSIIEAEYTFKSPKKIQGQVYIHNGNGIINTSVELSEGKWLQQFSVGKYYYKLIDSRSLSNNFKVNNLNK